MRRGYSLIELIVVMTVGATLVGIAVTLLGTLLQADRAVRSHHEQNAMLDRLAERFRRDAHAAEGPPAVEKNAEGEPAWRFVLPDGHDVWYVLSSAEVVREERNGKAIVRQESYLLPEDCVVAVAVADSAVPSIVSLLIAPADVSLRPGHEIRIDAALGRDHRFARRGGGK